MTKGILGKSGMTQIFTEAGELIPATVIEATQTLFFAKTAGNRWLQRYPLVSMKREVLSNKPC